MAFKQPKNRKKKKRYPERSKDVWVTQEMLFAVRDEFKADLKKEIHRVKSSIEELKSEIHQMRLLFEEQNARNRIVLDGLTSLFARQERIEKELATTSK